MSSSLLVVAFHTGVVALDQKTGVQVWETSLTLGRSQVVVHDDHVYVASEQAGLCVLDASNGQIIKQATLSGSGQAPTLFIEGERVFVSCGGEIQAFSLEGEMLWTNACEGKGNGPVSMATKGSDRQADEY
ncbi:PQQ-binding-like beta-propeller repeat protein [Patescibacteria group bacterium]|nr:PQQ-binding-like beta-propeller repeat protein [Patescibacteria group bacterium]